MEMKKGFVFTMDVLIGLGIIIIIFIFSSLEFSSVLPEKKYQKLNFVAEDTMDLLIHLQVKDVKDKPTIVQLIKEGVITEKYMDKSVLDLIAGFYYMNNKTIAANITQEVLGELTNDVNIQLSVDGQNIYSSSSAGVPRDVAVASRIESGYEPGKPTYGYIARAYLTKIRGKRDSSYAYFGGYVGDGNITRNITLPSFDKILEAYMEMDAGNSFTLYINGNHSGFYMNGSAGGGYMRADKWIVCNTTYNRPYCNNFTIGGNVLSFIFTGNRSFIGGGYFRVTYNTTQMAPEEEVGRDRYWFPGIHGLINLYDSFYVPGTLISMNASLHYYNNLTVNNTNATIYFFIGNKKVFKSNETGEKTVTLTYDNISEKFGSEQNLINAVSNKTIPIRLGTEIVNESGGGNADIILITDLSGSMDWCISNTSTNCPHNVQCNNPMINTSNQDRISKAKCLDKEFVNITLSNPGNKVGLVGFDGVGACIKSYTPFANILSNNTNGLNSEIGNYSAGGSTCIACSINRAYDILRTQSDSSRQKFIVVMTDGLANSDPQTANVSSPCKNGINSIINPCGDTVYNSSVNNATYTACRTYNNLNATIYSIGFGPVATCAIGNYTLKEIAKCGKGSYYGSSNVTELENIYRAIAKEIVELSYRAQLIEIKGNVPLNNTLYPDSYIEFNYTPIIIPYEYGQISLTRETARLKDLTGDTIDLPYKEGWFNVSEQVKVVDAKITSYSSEYWTDRVYFNSSKTGQWTSVYLLSYYGNNYTSLGDPYIVQIPVNNISSGNNSVGIGTGISPSSATGGSPDDRVIYTLRIKGFVPYSDVPFNTSENATQDAIWRLNNSVGDYVDITSEDVRIENKTVRGLQWLYGPSLLKVIVW